MENSEVFITPPSYWPIVGSFAVTMLAVGAVNWLHGEEFGPYLFFAGLASVLYLMYGWFGTVIAESRSGLKANKLVNTSLRWGMAWFIFSEVMFFGVFFGTLFYLRIITVPNLAGQYDNMYTHVLLWPNFKLAWPLIHTPDPSKFLGPGGLMHVWGIPAINTAILLTSGVTITFAHWALVKDQIKKAAVWQFITALLGMLFLYMQACEYLEAYLDKGLRLDSGVYGNTFFMLTGFHGLHVTIGTISLLVILFRMLKNDFNSKYHFAFEAIAWYWHFVDVVWLILFIFVYWI